MSPVVPLSTAQRWPRAGQSLAGRFLSYIFIIGGKGEGGKSGRATRTLREGRKGSSPVNGGAGGVGGVMGNGSRYLLAGGRGPYSGAGFRLGAGKSLKMSQNPASQVHVLLGH